MPTLAERPDLAGEFHGLSSLWPEFMLQDATGELQHDLFHHSREHYLDWQFAVLDPADPGTLLGRASAVGVSWPADSPELPARGWDAAIEEAIRLAVSGQPPVSVCALEISLTEAARGRGLARACVSRLCGIGAERGLQALFAPVRPPAKAAAPEISMAEYLARRRDDGSHPDSWLRTHVQLGGEVLGVAPLAMTITGTYQQWQQWTGRDFSREPGTTALVEGALAPVMLDPVAEVASYIEPNVWIRHRLGQACP